MSKNQHVTDVLIIGSGAAGLSLALQLPKHLHITVICKTKLNEGSTFYAQGGIAAVMDANDSIESHVQDTLNAGGGLCKPEVIRFVVEQAKASVQWLIDLGVPFTRANNPNDYPYHLNREGGHSHRRILHADDATGKAVSLTLSDMALAKPNITCLEHFTAIDIIKQDDRCVGAYLYDIAHDQVITCQARSVILATGGASKVYLYSTNPDVSSGDGIAMAWRAGARVANLEFNQFHPTCLYHPEAQTLLLTEAIRGEGGHLLLPDGERFMLRFHEQAELAPRDVVARAIDYEMKRLGLDHVYLDISHKGREFVQHHFPNLYEQCLALGLDMANEPMPVVPAAHYTCGGVVTDLQGRTNIENLFAIGETACTGLHGANRMASNSLLECLVFAHSCAKYLKQTLDLNQPHAILKPWDDSQVINSDEAVVVTHNWDELRRFMWDYVGIVRSNKRLARAQKRINLLKQEVQEYYSNYRVNRDLLELRNLVIVADLIVQCAIARKENRGLHFNIDLETSDLSGEDVVLSREVF
jgi:L-aspartate oxidase